MIGDQNFQDAVPVNLDGIDDDGAVTLTVAAVAGKRWACIHIHAGFDVAPAAAVLLTVSVDGSVVWTMPIFDKVPHEFLFPRGIWASASRNGALVVALAASGSAGRSGYLNMGYV